MIDCNDNEKKREKGEKSLSRLFDYTFWRVITLSTQHEWKSQISVHLISIIRVTIEHTHKKKHRQTHLMVWWNHRRKKWERKKEKFNYLIADK